MINTFLFLSGSFLFIFLVGKLLEKIRVPWIFSALLLGAILSIHNPFPGITGSNTFVFLAELGMYFLLFMVGLEIDLNKFLKKKKFLITGTIVIIATETLFGSLLIHFVFHYDWPIAVLVAASFATVGEAILVPILDEFKMINTKLGQYIIGIGTLDDVVEIAALIGITFFISKKDNANVFLVLGALFVLLALTIILIRFRKQEEKFPFKNIETMFFFVIFMFFLFLGIGQIANATALAALLAGISVKNFIPKERFKLIGSEIKMISYGLFAPIFFLWVGTTIDMQYLLMYPLLILAVVGVSKFSKLFGSVLIGRKELGFKGSILMGIGLSVRFSSSIIIIKLLYENHVIEADLYSIIIASSIIFKFIVPLLFSNLLIKWKFAKNHFTAIKEFPEKKPKMVGHR